MTADFDMTFDAVSFGDQERLRFKFRVCHPTGFMLDGEARNWVAFSQQVVPLLLAGFIIVDVTSQIDVTDYVVGMIDKSMKEFRAQQGGQNEQTEGDTGRAQTEDRAARSESAPPLGEGAQKDMA